MASILSTARYVACKLPIVHLRCPSSIALHQYRRLSTTQLVHAKRYTRDHEWIDLAENDPSIGTVGISNFAARALGDIVYVELPVPDVEVKAGDAMGAVESVKSASDIKAPVEGKIVTANMRLEEQPALMGTKAESGDIEGGWFAKVEIGEVGLAEWEKLMDEKEYEAFIREQE